MRATTLGPGAVRTDGLLTEIASGGCSAWPLPRDETSPRAARAIVRRTLTAMGVPDDDVADAVVCVSELSTNAITHAPGGHLPAPPVAPELWVYRRGQEGRPQLVVAVFDALCRWRERPAGGCDELAEGGRGLDIVNALAGGRSGWHLTRSRLGARRVPGKACWFALPMAATCASAVPPPSRPTEAQAAAALAALVTDRGIDHLIHHDAARHSVLSVRHGPTVWCRAGAFWWTGADGTWRRPFSDVVEVAERVVQLHEERTVVAAGRTSGPAAGVRQAETPGEAP
ncbi:MAG TPA: ATP-binding protein [Streptosporangiaceae bacterium]|nr:ATP-binding protein [Streptosporangiaceae bacterium]